MTMRNTAMFEPRMQMQILSMTDSCPRSCYESSFPSESVWSRSNEVIHSEFHYKL